MKKKLQFTRFTRLLLMLAAPAAFAQWQDGTWVGKQANNFVDSGILVDFNSGNAIPNFGYPLRALEGSTTISDSNGALLFFAGNNTIWNRDRQVMLNGDGLIGGDTSSTMFGVFVPKPGTTNIYYLFNVSTCPSTTFPNTGLVYSEVDLSLDGGLGGVTANKNIVLDANVGAEKITAVYHADGENIWVISHRTGSTDFVAYLVTAAGVSTTPVVTSIGNLYPSPDPANEGIVGYWGGAGQMKAAPDGSKIAATILDGPNKGVDVFDFDNATGTLSNVIHLSGYSGWPYGLEFSPNSHFLYTANPAGGYSNGGTIEQYDVTLSTEAGVIGSKQIIMTAATPWLGNGGMVLGANGRIYIKDVLGEATNIIKNPNNPGLASGYQIGGLPMSYGIGMPTFNQTYLQSGIIHRLGCPGGDVAFELVRIPDVTSVAWDFGDPASGASNTGTVAAHTFSAGGTYTVTAQITSNGGVQTASVEITVPGPGAGAVTPANLALCDEGTAGVFNLSAQSAAILTQLGSGYTVTYFTSEADAQNNTGAITTPATYPSTGATIWARASNADNTCFDIVSFDLELITPPVVTTVADISECDTNTADGFTSFNLTTREAALINGQSGVTVTYYTSLQDAENGTGAITTPTNFINTANPQVIYVTLVNAAGCHSHTSFGLNVLPQPVVATLPDISLCDDATADSFTTFNLAQQDALLQQGQPGVTIGYYTSQANAQAGTAPITATGAFVNTVNPQTIYVALTNASGCKAYTDFNINVLTLPAVAQAPDLSLCDDATADGFTTFDLTVQNALYQQGQAGVTVGYFTSLANAEANTSAIATPNSYTNTANGQQVYVRISNANCYAVGSFELNVISAPVIADDLQLTGCPPFNLTEIESNIDSNLDVSYYTSSADASLAMNAIATPQSYIADAQSPVYVRVENIEGCYDVATLHISLGNCNIQRGISPGGTIGDNDNFDLAYLDVRKISIFNRYGKEVYSFRGSYTNQWGGQGSNGDELPTGTYFYMFERNNGESKTGWIYINRQN